MFDNQSANNVQVVAKLVDGSIVEGAIVGGVTSNLATVLNRPGNFIEIVQAGGHKRYLGANQIVTIEPARPLAEPDLPKPMSANTKTAHKILDLDDNCTPEKLREQYRKMVKLYHPDKFQSVGLPPEVQAYVQEMFNAISRAHDIIEKQIVTEAA
jgi:hypothetical protein